MCEWVVQLFSNRWFSGCSCALQTLPLYPESVDTAHHAVVCCCSVLCSYLDDVSSWINSASYSSSTHANDVKLRCRKLTGTSRRFPMRTDNGERPVAATAVCPLPGYDSCHILASLQQIAQFRRQSQPVY